MNNLKDSIKVDKRMAVVDIVSFLDNMESEYKVLLDSDIEVAQTQDEVSEYTRDTCYRIKSNLELLKKLGLLYDEELDSMRELADEIRMSKIKANSEKEE